MFQDKEKELESYKKFLASNSQDSSKNILYNKKVETIQFS